jgi:hypothetical protein
MRSLAIALAFAAICTTAADANVSQKYLHHYNQVAEAQAGPYHGLPGRNLVKDGTSRNRPATHAELRAAIVRMTQMVRPEPSPVIPTPSTAPAVSTPSAPVSTGGGSYSIPEYIVQCESGGSYTASNPSGAYGAYQIMPYTAENYGCDLSTPAGQDACAAEIYADVGSSAWSCG